jgi:hypothetical protein
MNHGFYLHVLSFILWIVVDIGLDELEGKTLPMVSIIAFIKFFFSSYLICGVEIIHCVVFTVYKIAVVLVWDYIASYTGSCISNVRKDKGLWGFAFIN